MAQKLVLLERLVITNESVLNQTRLGGGVRTIDWWIETVHEQFIDEYDMDMERFLQLNYRVGQASGRFKSMQRHIEDWAKTLNAKFFDEAGRTRIAKMWDFKVGIEEKVPRYKGIKLKWGKRNKNTEPPPPEPDQSAAGGPRGNGDRRDPEQARKLNAALENREMKNLMDASKKNGQDQSAAVETLLNSKERGTRKFQAHCPVEKK